MNDFGAYNSSPVACRNPAPNCPQLCCMSSQYLDSMPPLCVCASRRPWHRKDVPHHSRHPTLQKFGPARHHESRAHLHDRTHDLRGNRRVCWMQAVQVQNVCAVQQTGWPTSPSFAGDDVSAIAHVAWCVFLCADASMESRDWLERVQGNCQSLTATNPRENAALMMPMHICLLAVELKAVLVLNLSLLPWFCPTCAAGNVMWPDQWTAATADGKRTAQFEHTLLLTEDGAVPLTAKIESSPRQFWEVSSSRG